MPKKTLVLFTAWYPYSTGETFIESEITYLARAFERVIIVPSHIKGEARSVPPNVEVDIRFSGREGFAQAREAALSCLTSALFYKEVPRALNGSSRLQRLRRLVIHQDKVTRAYRWIMDYCRNHTTAEMRSTLFYTYWCLSESIGLARAKRGYPALRIVARAHGSDLYEHKNIPPYLPFTTLKLKGVDRIFPISTHGLHYIAEQFPFAAQKSEVSRLGVIDFGVSSHPSQDGVWRVVSCSALMAVKRIELLADGLGLLAEHFPGQQIEWHHLGDGPLRTKLEHKISLFPLNLHAFLHGQVTNREVFEFYRTHPIDLLINVSSSEGVPVSIMEAQSCGIPVAATAVGGTPEIVNDDNGLLLEVDITPESLSDSLLGLMKSPQTLQAKRAASRNTWETLYSAEKNYTQFASRLLELVNVPAHD